MGKIGSAAGTVAAGLLVAQPCAAQSVDTRQFARPASAFAGVSLSMALAPASKPKPVLRLRFAADPGSRDGKNPNTDFMPRGLEIGWLDSGKPALFVNGRTAVDARDQLGLGGSGGQTALIIGGVLVAVVVLAVAAGGAGPGDTCPTIGGSRDHCINP